MCLRICWNRAIQDLSFVDWYPCYWISYVHFLSILRSNLFPFTDLSNIVHFNWDNLMKMSIQGWFNVMFQYNLDWQNCIMHILIVRCLHCGGIFALAHRYLTWNQVNVLHVEWSMLYNSIKDSYILKTMLKENNTFTVCLIAYQMKIQLDNLHTWYRESSIKSKFQLFVFHRCWYYILYSEYVD